MLRGDIKRAVCYLNPAAPWQHHWAAVTVLWVSLTEMQRACVISSSSIRHLQVQMSMGAAQGA